MHEQQRHGTRHEETGKSDLSLERQGVSPTSHWREKPSPSPAFSASCLGVRIQGCSHFCHSPLQAATRHLPPSLPQNLPPSLPGSPPLRLVSVSTSSACPAWLKQLDSAPRIAAPSSFPPRGCSWLAHSSSSSSCNTWSPHPLKQSGCLTTAPQPKPQARTTPPLPPQAAAVTATTPAVATAGATLAAPPELL